MPLAIRWLQVVLSIVLLTALAAGARAELPLHDVASHGSDAPLRLLLLEEPHSTWTIRDAYPRLLAHGQIVDKTPSLGWSDSSWWLGLRLSDRAGGRYYLWLDHMYLDDVQLWVFAGGKLQLYRETGDLLPFARRDAPLRGFLLPLPTLGMAPQDVILRVKSTSSVSMPLKLIPAEQKDRLLVGSWLTDGLIVGALLVMALCSSSPPCASAPSATTAPRSSAWPGTSPRSTT